MIDKISRLGYRNLNITGPSFVAMGDFIEKLENLRNLTLNLAEYFSFTIIILVGEMIIINL